MIHEVREHIVIRGSAEYITKKINELSAEGWFLIGSVRESFFSTPGAGVRSYYATMYKRIN